MCACYMVYSTQPGNVVFSGKNRAAAGTLSCLNRPVIAFRKPVRPKAEEEK